MHYTWWDMIAFFELAQLTKLLNIDLFHYVTPAHQSLKQALDWIAPWTLEGAKPWPYPEVSPFDHGKFFQIFRMASIYYDEDTYETMITKLPGNVDYMTNHLNLVWPKRAATQDASLKLKLET